jgi:hypothetical protein
MPFPTPASLYRGAAAAGAGSAVVLLINAAKRAEVISTTAFTQLVAPLAQVLALVLVVGLYMAFGRRAGRFGLVAFLVNAFALVALVGVEFVINLVFAELPTSTIDTLREGPLGIALTMASVLFLLGTLGFVATMVRGRELPTVPLVMYAASAVPIALRAFVPEAVLDLGLVTLAVGIAWLAAWFFTWAGSQTSPKRVALEKWTTQGVRPPASGLVPRDPSTDLVNSCTPSEER